MIKAVNIKKIYRTDEIETTAVNGISLDIKEGEFVSIMGPSGCGKSTLLNLLGMIDTPDAGEYHFLGENITHYSEFQRSSIRKKNLGFIFQSFNLIDELSVFENVELPMVYNRIGAKERKQRTTDILEQLEMMHRAQHFPQQLSGGQQQRVAIARATIMQPKLILADEPTGNLDSKMGEEVMNILGGLHERGTTILMVTHDTILAEYGDRIIKLIDGQILMEKNLIVGH